MEKEIETKKKGKGLVIVIIIMSLIILGMAGYICYDKGIIFNNKKEETSSKQSDTKKESKETDKDTSKEEKNTDTKEEIKDLDLTKCINNSNMKYINPQEKDMDVGLEIVPGSITVLKINWEKFGPLSRATAFVNETIDYKIDNFLGKIKSGFVGGEGQDTMGTILFYLMEDGTVEYTKMFNLQKDAQGNSYYTMNYSYDNDSEGKSTKSYFSSQGKIKDVKDVIKFYTVSANGYVTTIGATKDGSFYDLGYAIRN